MKRSWEDYTIPGLLGGIGLLCLIFGLTEGGEALFPFTLLAGCYWVAAAWAGWLLWR